MAIGGNRGRREGSHPDLKDSGRHRNWRRVPKDPVSDEDFESGTLTMESSGIVTSSLYHKGWIGEVRPFHSDPDKSLFPTFVLRLVYLLQGHYLVNQGPIWRPKGI